MVEEKSHDDGDAITRSLVEDQKDRDNGTNGF